MKRHPYHFIPLNRELDQLKQVWPQSDPAGHERYDRKLYSGSMRCDLLTKTPLALKNTWDRDTTPRLPGTALKGLIRTTAQMTGAGCADRFLFDEGEGEPRGIVPCTRTSACPVCRIFGYAPANAKDFGWAAKVRFFDSEPAEQWRGWATVHWPEGNVRLQQDSEHVHRSFYYEKSEGRITEDPLGWKVHLHAKELSGANERFQPELVVPESQRFGFRVEFENLTAEEYWIFHFALTLTHRDCGAAHEPVGLYHKFGYGKALGLGSCNISAEPFGHDGERYFGNGPEPLVPPPCTLGRLLEGAGVRAMRQWLSWEERPWKLQFPEDWWFKENPRNTIDDWETELNLPPPEEPQPAGDAKTGKAPQKPTGVVDVTVSSVKGGVMKGTTACGERTFTCTVKVPHWLSLVKGAICRVRVLERSVNEGDRTFGGDVIP